MVHQERRERKFGAFWLGRHVWQDAGRESNLVSVLRSGIRHRPP
jgi:hypothetical protein